MLPVCQTAFALCRSRMAPLLSVVMDPSHVAHLGAQGFDVMLTSSLCRGQLGSSPNLRSRQREPRLRADCVGFQYRHVSPRHSGDPSYDFVTNQRSYFAPGPDSARDYDGVLGLSIKSILVIIVLTQRRLSHFYDSPRRLAWVRWSLL